jgi:hypothetical protein
MKPEGVEIVISHTVRINCLVIKFPFAILNGLYHEWSNKTISASSQHLTLYQHVGYVKLSRTAN